MDTDAFVEIDGMPDGKKDGVVDAEGKPEGEMDGAVEGDSDGKLDGFAEVDGKLDGNTDGVEEGKSVGRSDGVVEGKCDADGKLDGVVEVEGKSDRTLDGLMLEDVTDGSVEGSSLGIFVSFLADGDPVVAEGEPVGLPVPVGAGAGVCLPFQYPFHPSPVHASWLVASLSLFHPFHTQFVGPLPPLLSPQ